MNKRNNFYPDGTFIPYQMPQDFRQSTGRGSCGNCGHINSKLNPTLSEETKTDN